MGKRKSKKSQKEGSLFRPPKHKWLADIITFEKVGDARRAAKRLVNGLKRKRIGDLKIGRERALAIARSLQNAANRARASAKRKNLSQKERKKLLSIARVYDKAADRAFEIYHEKYAEVS